MSLDIDVDLLVTEECPVTSLVQRMGRCNRHRDARSLEDSGAVLVYAPENNDSLPYDQRDLTGLSEFLKAVNDRDLSQTDLEHEMRKAPCPERQGDSLSRFLESGPYAVGPKEDDGEGFRDSNDFNRQCVLSDDVTEFRSALRHKRPGLILPVPKGKVLKREEHEAAYAALPGFLGVAPSSHYHAALGFLDKPVSQWSSQQ